MGVSEQKSSMDKRFWDFSLNIYGVPGVAPACLRCQDEAGADVNLILFLLWRAAAGYRLAEGEIASLDAHVTRWREHVVGPLRAMRRELKSESLDETGAFRERIKTVELERATFKIIFFTASIFGEAEMISTSILSSVPSARLMVAIRRSRSNGFCK